ncbi:MULTISPECIES: hypothetical protein [unclassified Micromonospora]|uniref:hypothetical protein n=1 Tax=unclassified Micromonospora TaxID=2617518 RepID=UPI0033251F1F
MSDPLSAFDAPAGRLVDIERRFAGLRADLDELSGTATADSGRESTTVDSGQAPATVGAALGAGRKGIFRTPGDVASLGRLEKATGRLGGRLPGPPA